MKPGATKPIERGVTRLWGVRTAAALFGVIALSFILITSSVSALTGYWTPPSLTKIAAGSYHSCALANGKVYCWGDNSFGQIGTGSGADYHTTPTLPAALPAGSTAIDVSVGGDYSCALLSNGKVYCWGDNNLGQLGGGVSYENIEVPFLVKDNGALSGKSVTAISSGQNHTCAIADGDAFCWGMNSSRQLGNTSVTAIFSNEPVAVTKAANMLSGKTVTDIDGGSAHTCAVASGVAYCWGANSSGQLGDNSITNRNAPVAVSTTAFGSRTPTAISSGGNHSCAIASGLAYCWGANSSRQLGGSGANSYYQVPNPVTTSTGLSGKTVTNISTGNSHSCAVASGVGYCWGLNNSRQLGDGTPTNRPSPAALSTARDLNGYSPTHISAGHAHTCLVASGRAFCAGSTSYGALGTNLVSASQSVPEHVKINDGIATSPYRFFGYSSESAVPGYPRAPVDSPAFFTQTNQPFRLRMGVKAVNANSEFMEVPASSLSLQLRYALKTASTCQAQSSGFSEVTYSTPISFYTEGGFISGFPISPAPNNEDPSNGPISYMTFHSGQGSYLNSNSIPRLGNGLWDFSLQTNNAQAGASYCLQLVHNGAPLDQYPSMAEVTIAQPASVNVGFVNSSGTSIVNPVFSMPSTNPMANCRTITGALIDSNGARRLRVGHSGVKSSWNVSVSPTAGSTAQWARTGGGTGYDFNDPSGSPAGCTSGSDGDGLAGQMTIRPNLTTLAPQSGCSASGLTKGSQASFSGTVNSITLLSASSAADANCNFDLYGGEIAQTIPAGQQPGAYSIDLTVTAVMP